MDLQTVYDEVAGLRKDLQAHLLKSAKAETDIAWLKRAVIGGFSFMFAVVGAVLASLKPGG